MEVTERAFEEELYSLEQCLRVNPKSYSVWQQRGWTLDHMGRADWTRELALCSKFLEYDERNCESITFFFCCVICFALCSLSRRFLGD